LIWKKRNYFLESPLVKPSADARLKKIFAKIGVPKEETFRPDSFQLEALEAINKTDCLVSAPTGSGKTWIAKEAIYHIHKKGGRSWYASPLKALTNSKYLEFSKLFGSEYVGILTGDRKENADAPIIVGTTEILRNQLYDAMHKGTDMSIDLVVLDEAHFLGDEDRGVVWEEIMIYLPTRIRLLLLSATIRNAHQIAGWLESIRLKSCIVVEEKERPVSLFPLFFHPSGRLYPLIINSKNIDKKVLSFLEGASHRFFIHSGTLPPLREIVKVMEEFDLLPAIFFMKSRSDCDEALKYFLKDPDFGNERYSKLNERIDELIQSYPYLKDSQQLWYLRNAAVAAHHSGQLPVWKLLVEQLMSEGLLKAVFATSTVAAGVNFPARSVVFLNSDRYNGHKFVQLNATEFHQMTGRAGRRGKDHIGFAIVIPGKFMDVHLIAKLFNSPPENVTSRIKIDFSMVLNLLLSHRPDEIKQIFQKSFATYLNMINQKPGLDKKLKKSGEVLMSYLPDSLCGGAESVINNIRKRVAIIKEIKDLKSQLKELESRLCKLSNLVPGRLFLDNRNRMYCIIKPQIKRDKNGVLACRLKGKVPRQNRRFKLRWFPPEKILKVLDKIINLSSLDINYQKNDVNVPILENEIPPISDHLTKINGEHLDQRIFKDRILSLEKELDEFICNKCPHFMICYRKTGKNFKKVLDDFVSLWETKNYVQMRLWNDFVKHMDLLKEKGFVTEDGKLTQDGVWASQLRLDQPLMIAEGLRKGLFPASDPVLLSALVASFVHDREKEGEISKTKIPIKLLKAYEMMKEALAPLVKLKTVRGFEVRPIDLVAAVAIYMWADGKPWDKVLDIVLMAEGDLAMLISRTADNLRQIASLKEVYPEIAKNALDAIAIIMREPIVAD
ncbi:MAG: hypothetical protein DRP55_08385, partial [Spirochaetes bacterium]